MEVVVKLFSGLGNQLFQYAAGRYYANLHNASLRLVSDLPHHAVSHNEFARPFLLQHFAVAERPREVTFWDRLMLSERPTLRVSAAPFKKMKGIAVIREPLSQRYRFLPSLAIDRETRTMYLVGYWQTHCIVDAVSSELRGELRFNKEAEGKNEEVLDTIRNTINSVSFHVRRGDYALAAEGNIVLPEAYYSKAIQLIQQRLIDPTFFVFSDDISFARTLLPQNVRKVFVDHNDDFASQEDLRLMSSCEHHIIANSTFSWWGAWLNPRASKSVVAPRHWKLNKESYYLDLLPLEWVLVDTDYR